MEPLVSIIVPVYNAAKYLPRCIESLIGQTYRNLEIILLDDGSPDNSGEICDKFAADDSRIVVVHKPNSGVSDTRNKGIEMANGEYLAFCDNDDFYSPYQVEILLNMSIAHDCDMAECAVRRGTEGSFNDPKPQNPKVAVLSNIDALKNFHIYCTNYCWNKIYRKRVFENVRFPVGSTMSEDNFIAPKAYFASNRIAFIKDQLYYHYTNPESVTQGEYSRKNLIDIGYIEDRLEFAQVNNLNEFHDRTLVCYFCNLKYYRVMCRKYMPGSEHDTAEMKRKQDQAYKLIMSSEFVSPKLKRFVKTGQKTPFIYDMYNYIKFNMKGQKMKWGEYYMFA